MHNYLKQFKGGALVLASSLLFGSYGIWAVLVGTDFGVYYQGYVRALLALLVLIPICFYLKAWGPIQRKDIPVLAVFSLFTVFTQAPLYYAFQNAGVGIASLTFFTAYLIMQYAFGFLVLEEKFTVIKVTSFLLALIGLVFIFDTSLGVFSLFALGMASLNGLASGGEVASTKLFSAEYSPLQASIISWVAIVVTHLPMSLLMGETQLVPAFTIQWGAMLMFAVAGSAAFFLVMLGYKYVEASIGGLIGLLEIIFAIIFGAVVFGEHVTTSIIIGSAIILIAAAIPYLYDLRARMSVKL